MIYIRYSGGISVSLVLLFYKHVSILFFFSVEELNEV